MDVHRSRWGASAPTRKLAPLPGVLLKGLAVHHSGDQSHYNDDHQGCPARVRAVQQFHQHQQQWADIAYHVVVCAHGVTYEGRPLHSRGAANGTRLGNARFISVCALGHYGRPGVVLHPRVEEALLRVRELVLARNPRAVHVWPHLRFTRTECPGRVLREWCRQFP